MSDTQILRAIVSKGSYPNQIKAFFNDALWAAQGNYFTIRCRFIATWSFSNDTIGMTDKLDELSQNATENFEFPNFLIDGGETVKDGMGVFYIQSNELVTPSENQLTMLLRETQVPKIDIIKVWQYYNSAPKTRPITGTLTIDYLSDADGRTVVHTQIFEGVRPVRCKSADARHTANGIMLRDVQLAFNRMY